MQIPSEHHHAPTPVPLLVHVGFHKTGSTWLQSNLFNRNDRGFTAIAHRPRHEIVSDFVFPDAFHFNSGMTRCRYEPSIEAARSKGLTLVISHERLSGYPPSGGYDRRTIADRLAETFPDCRILIVIREQRSLIVSMYSQYVTDGGAQGVKDFLRTPPPALGRMPYFRLEHYEFDSIIRHYKTLWGDANVLVLPYEMFAQDRQRFEDSLCRFCGHKPSPTPAGPTVNARRPALMQFVQRWGNRHFSRSELNPVPTLSINRFERRFSVLRPLFATLSPRWLERRLHGAVVREIHSYVGSHYESSNARTSRLIQLDLGEWSYPCSEQEDGSSSTVEPAPRHPRAVGDRAAG